MRIFTDELIEQLYKQAKDALPNELVNKVDLKQELLLFDSAMQHIENHPWKQLTVLRDTSSSLYKKIHETFIGPDPEEDYKEVIVWNVAEKLYVTAAVDHNPNFNVKWDVVIYEEGQEL